MAKIPATTIRIPPGVAHIFGADDPMTWRIHNRGPGRVLVEQTVLPPGESATFSGSDPIVLLSGDDRDTVVVVEPTFS
jgi:hypothetical protein